MAAAALMVVMLAIGAAGSAWLGRTHRSTATRMEHLARTVSLQQQAEASGAFAFALVGLYIITGNEYVLPRVRWELAEARDMLVQARVAHAATGHGQHTAELGDFIGNLDFAVGVVERIISFRQSGDVTGAGTALAAAAPALLQVKADYDRMAVQDRDALVALRRRATLIGQAAFWFAVVGGAAAAAVAVGAALYIGRSVLGPLSSLESAALAVARGDLKARAGVSGPRELARLGAAFNQMTNALTDVSERLKLEKQKERALALLRDSNEQSRAITDATTDAIIVSDGGGIVERWNPAAERLFGYAPGEAMGRPLHTLIVPDRYSTRFQNGLRQFGETGGGPFVGKTVELSARRKDGSEFPVEISLSSVMLDGRWHAVGIVRDITDRKLMQDVLSEQARRDALTTMLNHRTILEELNAVLAKARKGAAHAVAMADVDGLKAVNDTYGHAMGDTVLLSVAHALARDNAVVGRYGGDEFVVVLRGAGREAAEAYKKAVLEVLAGVRLTDAASGAPVPVLASIGLAVYPEDAETAAELIAVCDSAMYADKRQRSAASGDPSAAGPLGGDRAAEMVGQIVPLLTARGCLEEKLRLMAHRIAIGAGYEVVSIETFSDGAGHPGTVGVFARVPQRALNAWRAERRPATERPLLRLVLESRRPVVVDVPQNDERVPETRRRLLRAAAARSLILLPLSCEDQLIGVLAAASTEASAFTCRDVQFLTAVGNQAAAIIRMAALVDNLRSTSGRLEQAQAETVMLLAAAAEAHDQVTGLHLQNVRVLTEALARELGYSEVDAREAGLAAVLHDIGKIRVPDGLLLSASELTEAEWEVMKQHTIWGAEFLKGRRGFELAASVARSHHERWDGAGYPDGLAMDAIPDVAAMVAVADSFDAMTTDRPYRAKRSAADAMAEIIACSGQQFSPKVVAAMKRLYERLELPLTTDVDDERLAA